MSSYTRPLSEVLLAERLISHDDLRRAQAEQDRLGKSLGRVLIEMGLFTESGLVAVLAKQIGLEFVALSEVVLDPLAASVIPEHLARRHSVIGVRFDEDGRLVVAMSDPSNVMAVDDVRTVSDHEVRLVVATRTDILAAIERSLAHAESVDDYASGILVADDDELEELPDTVDDAPIVKFVNALIGHAVGDRASDIHIEPQEHELRVRYRVDGVLHEVTSQRKKIHAGVVSRLKIMADLDIAERRRPQDGRITLKSGGRVVELRVSTLPTVYGEKVVMRILDKSSVLLELGDLGFSTDNLARFERSFRKPYGMILATGPTGSGKSTTLYATLNVLNRPEVNTVTVEDPVEYRLAGISQVQIHNKAGLTFPAALRSILRQDPDIVLVGEMRDHETAQIGMEAALTGHLVLSTLHTNDAPSAVTRLTEMGIDPFLVASSIECVLGQRLARRLCERCREPYIPTVEELTAAGIEFDGDMPVLHRPVGCPMCMKTGYRGRLAVHEVMTVTEEIERLIVQHGSTDDIAKMARSQGMRTLREDGLSKVLAGLTTLEEIARVVA